MGAPRRGLQCIKEIGRASSTDHLSNACLIDFAADNAIGAGAITTVRSAPIDSCILRKRTVRFVAHALDLFDGMFVHGYFIGQRRATKPKHAN